MVRAGGKAELGVAWSPDADIWDQSTKASIHLEWGHGRQLFLTPTQTLGCIRRGRVASLSPRVSLRQRLVYCQHRRMLPFALGSPRRLTLAHTWGSGGDFMLPNHILGLYLLCSRKHGAFVGGGIELLTSDIR